MAVWRGEGYISNFFCAIPGGLPCHYLGMPPEAAEACLCLSLLRHNHLTGHIPHWRLASNDDACITNLHGDHGLPNGQGHRGLWLNI